MDMKRLQITCGLGVLLAATLVAAQEKPGVETQKTLTSQATLQLRNIASLELSPDGQRLALVVVEPVQGERRAQHIWMCDTTAGTVRQFTYSDKAEKAPRWSPDGKQLAFLSNRDGDEDQIYTLRVQGGEARAITKGKRSVQSFEWSPNGAQIAFLAEDTKTADEEKKEKE